MTLQASRLVGRRASPLGGLVRAVRRALRTPLLRVRFIRPREEDAELARVEELARDILASRPASRRPRD